MVVTHSSNGWMAILASIIAIAHADVDDNAIKCPLEWRVQSHGTPPPPDSVSTAVHGKTHYIARGNNSGVFSGGRWSDGFAYSVFKDEVQTYESNYEILTNPHNCYVDWLGRGYRGANRVFTNANSYIGRTVLGTDLLSGEINSKSGILYVVDKNREKLETGSFQVLRSFSKGLVLKMTDFHFLDDNAFPTAKDFVGLDEIVNKGDSNLVQTVKFTKRVLEKTAFVSGKSQQHTISVGVNARMNLGGFTPSVALDVGFSWGSGENLEFSKETETTIEVTREVIVPPFTAVQVCSTVNLADNFHVDYLAKGIYTAPGLTSQEIIDVLALDGKIGRVDPQLNVYVEESGSFAGSLTLSNQFITVPLYSPEGCSQLANKIKQYRDSLKSYSFNSTKARKYYQDIDNMIARMTSKTKRKINWFYTNL